MIRLYSLLFAMFAATLWVDAKTTGVGIPNIFPHMGSGAGNNVQGANNSRIIGYSYLKHNGAAFIPVDSTTYSYSFGRGGQLSAEDMDDNFVSFDHSYTYVYNAVTSQYTNKTHRFQTFSAMDNPLSYTFQQWISPGLWDDQMRYVYTYDNDNILLLKTKLEIPSGSLWLSHYTYNNVYDIDEKLIKVTGSTIRMDFTYDAGGNIIVRLDSVLNSSFQWVVQNSVFTFDAANHRTSYILQDRNGSGWVNNYKYEYTYSGNDLILTTEFSWKNGAWEEQGKHLYSYDSNHNKTVDEWQYWDAATSSFKPETRLRWTYNGYNQPTSYFSESYEPSISSWVYETGNFYYRYYYQIYSSVGVDGLSEGDMAVRLFPQPAAGQLNVEVAAALQSNYSLSVFDAQGRMVKQKQGLRGTREQLDVSQLPAGVYFLRVKTAEHQQSRQFVISR